MATGLQNALQHASRTTGLNRALARVDDVLGEASPSKLVPGFLRDMGTARSDVRDHVGTVAGAAAGYYYARRKHPILGIIGGASLGRNLPAMLNSAERGFALRNLVTTGGGIAGAIVVKKHPVLGFIGGLLAGGLASSLAKLG